MFGYSRIKILEKQNKALVTFCEEVAKVIKRHEKTIEDLVTVVVHLEDRIENLSHAKESSSLLSDVEEPLCSYQKEE